jgi:hypothetical protein
VTPPREFAASIRRAILTLPEVFTTADLAAAMGTDGENLRRLRAWRDRALESGALIRVSRGRYSAGPALVEDGGLGVGVQLIEDIRAAFDQAGGVLTFRDLLVELGREEGRFVRRLLDDSSLYTSGSPLPRYRTCWRLIDSERLTLPVPGNLLAFDLQMTAGGRLPDLPKALDRRRALIGEAVEQARLWRGLTVEEAVAVPAVANALDAALRATDVVRREGGESEPLAGWWEHLCESEGRGAALAHVLSLIEAGDQFALLALTCRFWNALGKALAVSPAFLSRGCVAGLHP